jgi:hypothetical protein
LGDPLKGNLLLFYKPLHLEAQQVSTRIEVRRHQLVLALVMRTPFPLMEATLILSLWSSMILISGMPRMKETTLLHLLNLLLQTLTLMSLF